MRQPTTLADANPTCTSPPIHQEAHSRVTSRSVVSSRWEAVQHDSTTSFTRGPRPDSIGKYLIRRSLRAHRVASIEIRLQPWFTSTQAIIIKHQPLLVTLITILASLASLPTTPGWTSAKFPTTDRTEFRVGHRY